MAGMGPGLRRDDDGCDITIFGRGMTQFRQPDCFAVLAMTRSKRAEGELNMPRTDGARVVADLRRLAEFGRYKTGVHRPTYSPVDVESRHWLAEKLREAGLDPVIDGIGNVIGRMLIVHTVLGPAISGNAS